MVMLRNILRLGKLERSDGGKGIYCFQKTDRRSAFVKTGLWRGGYLDEFWDSPYNGFFVWNVHVRTGGGGGDLVVVAPYIKYCNLNYLNKIQ